MSKFYVALKLCTRIPFKIFNNNDQQFDRHDFDDSFCFYPCA